MKVKTIGVQGHHAQLCIWDTAQCGWCSFTQIMMGKWGATCSCWVSDTILFPDTDMRVTHLPLQKHSQLSGEDSTIGT